MLSIIDNGTRDMPRDMPCHAMRAAMLLLADKRDAMLLCR